MKGYKIFDIDWRCRELQYHVGETAEIEGPLELCKNGLHFCATAVECLVYREMSPNCRYAEVLAEGDIVTEGNKTKYATNKLTVVRELTTEEFSEMGTGTVTETYKNGNKSFAISFVRGKRHGSYTGWYENGNISVQTHYTNGHIEGRQTDWDATGFKKFEAEYHEGRLHGRRDHWFHDGHRWTSTYAHDVLQGQCVELDERDQFVRVVY